MCSKLNGSDVFTAFNKAVDTVVSSETSAIIVASLWAHAWRGTTPPNTAPTTRTELIHREHRHHRPGFIGYPGEKIYIVAY
jgi:hypothetical protein